MCNYYCHQETDVSSWLWKVSVFGVVVEFVCTMGFTCLCVCRWVGFGKYDLAFPAKIQLMCCAPLHNVVVFITHHQQETEETGLGVTCENQTLKILSSFNSWISWRCFEKRFSCFCPYNESLMGFKTTSDPSDFQSID